MDTEKKYLKEEILIREEKVMFFNDVIINQCDKWMTEEEGNEIMMREIFKNSKIPRFKDSKNSKIQ